MACWAARNASARVGGSTAMDTDPRDPMSPARLRVGVFLILLWWIPVWLAAPVISAAFGLDAQNVLVGLIVVQTVLGALGALVAGAQIRSEEHTSELQSLA